MAQQTTVTVKLFLDVKDVLKKETACLKLVLLFQCKLSDVLYESPSNLSAIPGALEYVTRVSEPGSRNRVMLGLSLTLFGSTN